MKILIFNLQILIYKNKSYIFNYDFFFILFFLKQLFRFNVQFNYFEIQFFENQIKYKKFK